MSARTKVFTKEDKIFEIMTMIQEAAEIMNRMPRNSQQVVLALLRMMSYGAMPVHGEDERSVPFKRTGKSNFNLPPDFDEHFDDANDEIASMFCGELI